MSGLSRADFERLWEEIDASAQAAKFSQEATLRLAEFYRRLDEDDRRVADEVLVSWVAEGEEARRFDALALIDEFEIRSALTTLEADLVRLAGAPGPSGPFERAKLERIIARLR